MALRWSARPGPVGLRPGLGCEFGRSAARPGGDAETPRLSRLLHAALGLALAATTVAIATGPAAGAADAAAPRAFVNCDAMHRVYPHGVGRPGARDRTSGTPVTSFKRSAPLYNANRGSDRDGDGIACEAA